MDWPGEPEPAGGEDLPRGPGGEVSVEARLAALEDACAALARKVDGLAATVRAGVADEVRPLGDDLRHTVNELGRLFVRDLGRLAKLLDQHREAIVADLQPPPPPPTAPLPPVGAAEMVEAVVEDDVRAANEPPSLPGPPTALAGPTRRRFKSRKPSA